jgi:hypothetical protein
LEKWVNPVFTQTKGAANRASFCINAGFQAIHKTALLKFRCSDVLVGYDQRLVFLRADRKAEKYFLVRRIATT